MQSKLEHTTSTSNSTAPSKLMAVDDEVDITFTLKMMLKQSGFSVDVFNDPADALSNFKPDYYKLILLEGKSQGQRDVTLLGYLEAKNIPLKLEVVEETEQIKRYMEAYPNLILTDFFTFWLYRNGKIIDSATLADKSRLLTNRIIPRATGLKEVQHLLSMFCSFSPIPSVNAQQLATELALRRYRGPECPRWRCN
jgi:CheY-like chemotaxis protein